MIDDMPMPNVVTERKFGSFTLRTVDYRELTDEEIQQVLLMLIRQKRWKKLPKNKVFTCVTHYGAFDLS